MAAVLIAVTATLLGFAIEAGSGHHDLGAVFAAFYAIGCIAAVLLVRHSGIFTTVIQPPLILFVAVPTAYFLMHGSAFAGLKDVLISCGYPLIERFPLMMLTSAGVLLIGMARWYLATGEDLPVQQAGPSMFAGLGAKLSAALAKPDRGPDRAPRSRAPRTPREPRRDAQQRTDPRRQPPRRSSRSGEPERRRRTPPPQGRPSGSREAREYRDPYAPRPQRGGGYESYDPYPPYPPPPPRQRRPAPPRESTHHPVSRVRYRGDAPDDRY